MGAFTVLPMSQAIELKAGEVYEGSITVANPADAKEDFNYAVSVSPYMVTDENYTADLLNESNYTQITNWVEILDPTGTLKPNESKKIHFKISVPETAPGGGQYAAIAVRSESGEIEEEQTNIQNIFEIASILFASIDGETVHDGEILENNVPGFSVENPAKVSLTLSNSGNVHEKATTTITVKNVLTGEIVFPKDKTDMNQYVEYIMPGTMRHLAREVNGMADLGVYEISQTIQYMGETSVATSKILMCPIWFMVLVILTILAGILTIFKLIKLRKTRRVGL